MSIDGRNAVRGNSYTVYRATETDATGGETTRTWATLTTGTAMFETLTRERAQSLYGLDTHTVVRSKVALSPVVRPGDGVAIAAGEFAGVRFFVHAAPARMAHRELVLLTTTEAFP